MSTKLSSTSSISTSPPTKLGLALSGGGFRAAAFHLGVLKRLRELRLLEHVQVLSTVSGGSITGAYWTWWQAKRKTAQDALKDDNSWNEFESSLVKFMRNGIRWKIIFLGFTLPFLLIAVPTTAAGWWFMSYMHWFSNFRWISAVALGAAFGLLFAFTHWHRNSARLLENQYRKLFGETKVKDLGKTSGCHRPELCINATGLKMGELLIFSANSQTTPALAAPKKSSIWETIKKGVSESFSFLASIARDRVYATMQDTVPLARAVAASSAFPPVFTALRMEKNTGEIPKLGKILRFWLQKDDGIAYAIDGGVYDNQGSQILIAKKCQHMIVSDAALVLREDPSPSTWQLFSWRLLSGKQGALLRVSDIYQERARDLGYKRLRALATVGKALMEAEQYMLPKDYNKFRAKVLVNSSSIRGFSYIELKPATRFIWQKNSPRHDKDIIEAIAQVRTDLNGFSNIELSALMFHGYTLIDHCLRGYQSGWLTKLAKPTPTLKFHSSVKALNEIDWNNLRQNEELFLKTRRHLQASRSRLWIWRFFRRQFQHFSSGK